MPKFTTARTPPKTATAVDLPVFEKELDELAEPAKRAAELQGFTGKAGQTLVLAGGVDKGVEVLVGLGPREAFGLDNLRLGAASFGRAISGHTAVATNLYAVGEELGSDQALEAVVDGIGLVSYRFMTYKKKNPVKLARVAVVTESKGLRPALQRSEAILAAGNLARDLVNEPGGALLPAVFADKAKEVAAEAGIKATVWTEARIRRERLGGLEAVSLGSENPPRFLTLTYTPAKATGKVTLVGKGVTFDSGGLSLKTGTGMMTMKIDMAGAATTLAVMSALPALSVPVAVTAYLPLVENMPSGTAQRPGDVYTARNGKTVEVLNTDAEGRLILADALALAAESDTDAIIDIATLTGSASAALGTSYAALMATDDDLSDRLLAAAGETGERLWPLPLAEEYRSTLDSQVADLRNIGTAPYGGAIVAGLFLREFVGDKPWAHIDVGISAFGDANKGLRIKGATGCGVKLLCQLLRSWT